MTAVEMLPGPGKVDCPCGVDGCDKFGRPVKKRNGHVRGCPCQPCQNGRNSQGGKRRHRQFAKRAGVRTTGFNTSQEEAWRDWARWEVKTGKQVDPIVTKFEAARAQSELSRSFGDPRPFIMGVVPTEARRPPLVLLTADDWQTLIVPLLEQS